MKAFKFFYLIGLIIFFSNCSSKKYFELSLNIDDYLTNRTFIMETNDSLIIKDLITNKDILKTPLITSSHKIQLKKPTVVSYKNSRNSSNFHLGIISPQRKKEIILDKSGKIKSLSISDSLQQYLLSSNNSFISKNSSKIDNTDDMTYGFSILDSFKVSRQKVIDKYKSKLSSEEYSVLNFQNGARIYSYLFINGNLRKLDHQSMYWNFLDQIDQNSELNRSLPNNVIYKYEIEYLRRYNEIKSIAHFIEYINEETQNKDLANFFVAYYINWIIESPSYLYRHFELLTSDATKKVLKDQAKNPYLYLFEQQAKNHIAVQKGYDAPDFVGFDMSNNAINLQDFRGKAVMIDVWATWCGPCISQKPAFEQLALDFDADEVQFLSISVDDSLEKWKNFLNKNGETNERIKELILVDEMKKAFIAKYSVTSFPRYILIDKDGKFINANSPKPSDELKALIRGSVRTSVERP